MSEYIITCDEETASWIGNDVDSMRPIVRCKDCKYYQDNHNNTFSCVFTKITSRAHPDGFCAWPERREGAE